MWSACGAVSAASLQLLAACRSAADRRQQTEAVRAELGRLSELTRRVTDSLQAVSAEQIASMVEQEMAAMDSAIEAAAARIQVSGAAIGQRAGRWRGRGRHVMWEEEVFCAELPVKLESVLKLFEIFCQPSSLSFVPAALTGGCGPFWDLLSNLKHLWGPN